MSGLTVTQQQLSRAKSNKCVGWLYMDPHDFLALTIDISSVREWIEKAGPDIQTLEEYNSYSGTLMPWLDVDMHTGKVVGHEGRHRAAACMKEGVTKYPVAICLRKQGYPVYYTQPFIDENDNPKQLKKKFVTKDDVPKKLLGQFHHFLVRIDPSTMHEFWAQENSSLLRLRRLSASTVKQGNVMTIKAISRLKATKELAEFTQAQKQVIKTRLLPPLREILEGQDPKAMPNLSLFMSKSKIYPQAGSPGRYTPVGLKLKFAVSVITHLVKILEAVSSVGSELQRASEFRRFLAAHRKYNLRWKSAFPTMDMWLAKLPVLVRSLPTHDLTDLGRKLVDLPKSQDMRLLAKSWTWILQELEREAGDIIKKNGYIVFDSKEDKPYDDVKDGDKKLLAALKKVLPDWTVVKDSYGRESVVSPDKTKELTPYNVMRNGSYFITPRFKVDASDSNWSSWARLGVDGGEVQFDGGTPVQEAVQELLEKIQKAVDARKKTAAEGVNFNFGPYTKKSVAGGCRQFCQQT